MEVASLLARRERVQMTNDEVALCEEQLRRAVLTLWQTNLLRRTKLTVLDEVANGLSFYEDTFLREVPRLHCALEDRLQDGAAGEGERLASFLRMGSSIGVRITCPVFPFLVHGEATLSAVACFTASAQTVSPHQCQRAEGARTREDRQAPTSPDRESRNRAQQVLV